MRYRISLRKRRLAIFLLITFLQSIVLPPMASALTSGPTAPETMSFEPVDATDMVNLQTGDFTYNVPLLEVPGPEGGYPLSLSYHAGVKPLEDASWVGLGWSLSPGAINRIVNDYPDDHKNIGRRVEDYWEGGTTKTYSVGVGVGIANGAQLGLDISVSNDTYRGFGGNVGIGLTLGIKNVASASIGFSMGSSGTNINGGVGLGTKSGIGLSAGFSTNFQGGNSASFGISHGRSMSSLGVSLSSNGVKPSFKAAGMSAFQHNNNAGKISTRTFGFGIGIPIGPVIVNLGHTHTRYWMHETDTLRTNGSLYANSSDPGATSNGTIINSQISFDSYSLHQTDINIADHGDADWLQGGSYPAYDNYNINAQGISGNIQPYIFENGSLYRKQIRKGSNSLKETSFYHSRNFVKKVNFRFKNDFSNSLEITPPTLNLSVNNPTTNNQTIAVDNAGYNSFDQHLAGSKHIEWYTNAEIIAGNTPHLINYPGLDVNDRKTFTIENDLLTQMGGVSVTNESGVTYHYALPAYSYDEYIFTRSVDYQNVMSWNKQFNVAPYAYTWLLTAVTGPDFVDKNGNNEVDEDDWGYWVNFDYGKWTDSYAWRTPGTGTFKDINEKSETFSYGKKEIYYLDAIKTRTHTALFVKDIRKDGKSVSDKEEGGFIPMNRQICKLAGPPYTTFFAHTGLPISQMRLDKILLLKNSSLLENNVNLKTLKEHGSLPGDAVGFFNPCNSSTFHINYHLSDNVIDVSDLSEPAISAASNEVLKSIELDNNHYDLCPETANSFNNLSGLYKPSPDTGGKSGKLTLKSVKYKGRNNSTVMPPLNFYYDYQNPSTHGFSVGRSGETIWISNATDDWVGDIIRYTHGGKDYYLLLTNKFGSSNFNTIQLGENIPLSSHNTNSSGANLIRTKNAPFNASKYDYWGYYKSDATAGTEVSPSHVTRIPTDISIKNTDAWSLREVETSLGAKIKVAYENKKYVRNVWQKYNQLNINGIGGALGGPTMQLTFLEDIDLTDHFAPQDMIKLTGFTTNVNSLPITHKLLKNVEVSVVAVTANMLTVTNPLPTPNFNVIFQGQGFIKFMSTGESYGNGLRTKSIAVSGSGDQRETIYNYQSGCISYNPSSLEYIKPSPSNSNGEEYEKLFNEDLSYIIALARELPPPMVMYKNVGITEAYNGIPVPGEKKYTFQIPEEDMITIEYSDAQAIYNSPHNPANGLPADVRELSKQTVKIKDKTSQIGNLLKVEQINGQGLFVSKIENDYSDDEPGESEADYAAYYNQGIIHQAFNEMRTKHTGNEDHRFIKGVVSVREEFPSILKSTKSYNNDLVTTTKNVEFDFYSGHLTISETENLKGEIYRSESIPAYEKYPEMGLQVNNSNNRHMLSQTAYSQVSEIDDWGGDIVQMLDANVTTWNKEWAYRELNSSGNYVEVSPTVNKEKIYRKHKNYIWQTALNPDGTFSHGYPNQTTQFMNWTTGIPISNQWNLASETTLYDHYSKPLEQMDIDENYAATKMGYEESMVIAGISNAKYTEFAYSGAEDLDATTGYFGGEVALGNASINSTPYVQGVTHTGHHIIGVSQGREGFLFKAKIGSDVEAFATNDRRYQASVWWSPNNPGIDLDKGRLFYRIENASGAVLHSGDEVLTPEFVKEAGNWHLLKLNIEIPSGYNNHYLVVGVRNEGTTPYEVYFDDFRFHPMDAAMTSYVYDKLTGEVTFILDGENMFTQYEYNDKGQLIKTYVETTENPTGKRLVTESEVHYKRPLD